MHGETSKKTCLQASTKIFSAPTEPLLERKAGWNLHCSDRLKMVHCTAFYTQGENDDAYTLLHAVYEFDHGTLGA